MTELTFFSASRAVPRKEHPPNQTESLTLTAVGPYSHAIRAAGLVFCAGQIAAHADGTLVAGSIAEKTAACIRSLVAVLDEAGSSLRSVVRVGVFLSSMDYYAEMNAEYEQWLPHRPARTCVAVRELPRGVDVEFDAVAVATR